MLRNGVGLQDCNRLFHSPEIQIFLPQSGSGANCCWINALPGQPTEKLPSVAGLGAYGSIAAGQALETERRLPGSAFSKGLR